MFFSTVHIERMHGTRIRTAPLDNSSYNAVCCTRLRFPSSIAKSCGVPCRDKVVTIPTHVYFRVPFSTCFSSIPALHAGFSSEAPLHTLGWRLFARRFPFLERSLRNDALVFRRVNLASFPIFEFYYYVRSDSLLYSFLEWLILFLLIHFFVPSRLPYLSDFLWMELLTDTNSKCCCRRFPVAATFDKSCLRLYNSLV